MKKRLLHILPFLVLSSLLLTPLLIFPFGVDQEHFVYNASAWLQGFPPYLGSWNHNPPGMIFVHLLPVILFGTDPVGFRFFEYLGFILALTYIAWRLSRSMNRYVGILTITLFASWYIRLGYKATGQRDSVVTLLFIGILLLSDVFTRRKQSLSLALMGSLASLMILFRPGYILLAPFPIIWFILSNTKLKKRIRIIGILWYVLGYILPIIILALFLIAIGLFHSTIEHVILYNVQIYGRSTQESIISIIQKTLLTILPIAIGGIILFFTKWIPKKTSGLILWLGFFITSVLSIFIQRHFFLEYVIPFQLIAAVVFSLVIFHTISRIFRRSSFAKIRLLQISIFVSIIIAIYLLPLRFKQIYLQSLIHLNPSLVRQEVGQTIPGFDEQTIASFSNIIKQNTNTSDRIQVLGNVPNFYLSSERLAATRFHTISPLFMRPDASSPSALILTWRREFFDTMTSHPPAFIIAVEFPEGFFFPEMKSGFNTVREEMPELAQWIQENYLERSTQRGFLLLKLKSK
jgi:hypothetical protein